MKTEIVKGTNGEEITLVTPETEDDVDELRQQDIDDRESFGDNTEETRWKR